MSLQFILSTLYIRPYTTLLTSRSSPKIQTSPPRTIIKQYTLTGSRWNDHNLELQRSDTHIPFLWITSNNKYGPWKDPYVTIHEHAHNGRIVAAAKMGTPGWKRDFRVLRGEPDCTDLGTWPVVKCAGKWGSEHRFEVFVEGEVSMRFAWRRTRDRQLGASKKWHRDFKLVALDGAVEDEELYLTNSLADVQTKELNLLDIDVDETKSNEKFSIDEFDGLDQVPAGTVLDKNERIIGVYIHQPHWKSSPRQAQINFFESLPPEVETHCLTVIMGLQEKISRNQDAFTCYSAGYGGTLRSLGNYI